MTCFPSGGPPERPRPPSTRSSSGVAPEKLREWEEIGLETKNIKGNEFAKGEE